MANSTVPTKNTGDSLSASEVNNIVQAVNSKVDSNGTKVLSDVNFSIEKDGKLSLFGQKLGRIGAILNTPCFNSRFGMYKGLSSGSDTGSTFQYWTKNLVAGVGHRLVFGNFAFSSSIGGGASETNGTNSITIQASVYLSGFYQVTFNGTFSTTIQPGAIVVSDPIPLNIPANTSFAIRTSVEVATGGKYPLGYKMISTNNDGTLPVNSTVSGTLTLSDSYGYHPICILTNAVEYSNKAFIGIYCDSIGIGSSSGGTGNEYEVGWIARGFNENSIPFLKCGVGGDVMANHVGRISFQLSYSTGVDIAFCNYGANDIPTFTSLDDAKSKYLSYWTLHAALGKKVIQSTILPRTSFTASQELIRIGLNDWIRTTPTPLSSYVEVADLAETARNSGIWKTGYSSDGVHPNYNVGEVSLKVAISNNLAKFIL